MTIPKLRTGAQEDRGRRGGFTLLELITVVAIISITAAWAVPSFRQMQSDSNLRSVAREAANAFQFARNQAIMNETVHIVYLGMGAGTDACGNPLVDGAGNPVPIGILNDGAPGTALQNCCIDAGEVFTTEPATPGVFWGTSFAGGAHPEDTGLGDYTTGSSFADQFGAQTRWVGFRPDGVPVGFTGACVQGQTGSGKGGVYVTNGPPFTNRDYAVLLTPLGGTKVFSFDRAAGAWTD